MEIEINLWNDYVAALSTHLSVSGFQLNGTETDESIVIGFFNWQKRKVQPTPRVTNFSREFNCPAEFQAVITTITQAISSGQDITPYLSKRIGDLDYTDLMLNDWGVHHLHLGGNLDNSGFIKRTGPLLFVRFTEEAAYFINIYAHGAWSKQDIVKTIHTNWPEIISQYKVNGVTALSYNASDDEVLMLRNAHINTFIQVDSNTIYAPIGMGSMSSGTSMEVMLILNKTRRALRKAEEAVKNAALSSPQDFPGKTKIKFTLELNGNSAHAVEESTRVAYKLW